jgi:hypothetical protein
VPEIAIAAGLANVVVRINSRQAKRRQTLAYLSDNADRRWCPALALWRCAGL